MTPFRSRASFKKQKEILENENVWISYKMTQTGCIKWFRGKVLKVRRSGKVKIAFDQSVSIKIMYVDRTLLNPKNERKTWMFDEEDFDPNDEEKEVPPLCSILSNEFMSGFHYNTVYDVHSIQKKLKLKTGNEYTVESIRKSLFNKGYTVYYKI